MPPSAPSSRRLSMSNDQPVPDTLGHYGRFGGRFATEALFAALDEVTTEWDKARKDPTFQAELDRLFKVYIRRHSPLTAARDFVIHDGGTRLRLKRWGLDTPGCHHHTQ